MNLLRRVRVWLSKLLYPGDRAIGNTGNGEPGSYKNAHGCLADDTGDEYELIINNLPGHEIKLIRYGDWQSPKQE